MPARRLLASGSALSVRNRWLVLNYKFQMLQRYHYSGSGPSDLDVVGGVSNRARLLVEPLHAVPIFKVPRSFALRLVVVETALKASPVW